MPGRQGAGPFGSGAHGSKPQFKLRVRRRRPGTRFARPVLWGRRCCHGRFAIVKINYKIKTVVPLNQAAPKTTIVMEGSIWGAVRSGTRSTQMHVSDPN